MGILVVAKTSSENGSDYDRAEELKAFDATKAGVKGLVDVGVVNIPRIFIRPPEELVEELITHESNLQIPVVDFGGIRHNKLEDIVDQVRAASETPGFFKVVNHRVPLNLLEEMIDGLRKFNQQDLEVKKQFYTRDPTSNVRFNSNFDLYFSRTANWRDTLGVYNFDIDSLDPNQLREVCRHKLYSSIC